KASAPEDAGAVFDFTVSSDESGVVPLSDLPSSSSKIGPSSSSLRGKSPRPAGSKSPPPAVSSDSDVRLVAEGSDLDFRIAEDSPRPASSKKGGSSAKSKLPGAG